MHSLFGGWFSATTRIILDLVCHIHKRRTRNQWCCGEWDAWCVVCSNTNEDIMSWHFYLSIVVSFAGKMALCRGCCCLNLDYSLFFVFLFFSSFSQDGLHIPTAGFGHEVLCFSKPTYRLRDNKKQHMHIGYCAVCTHLKQKIQSRSGDSFCGFTAARVTSNMHLPTVLL